MLVGILALQGDFLEHKTAAENLGYETKLIKTRTDLSGIDRLIIPGGESTTIGLLAQKNNLIPQLQKFIKSGKPVWGTCAGLILLANKIKAQKTGGQVSFGGLDIEVARNYYGSQIASFETKIKFKGIERPIVADFIRAPAITKCGRKVEVLGEHNKKAVAVRQGNILGTCFHSEITGDNSLSKYFLS